MHFDIACREGRGKGPCTKEKKHHCWANRSFVHVQLPVYITEFSISGLDPAKHAYELEKFLRIAFSHDAVAGITMGDLWDKGSSHASSGLYAANKQAKPAAAKLDKLWREEWHTEINEAMHNDGTLDFEGFYGTYQYQLMAGDQVCTGVIELLEVVCHFQHRAYARKHHHHYQTTRPHTFIRPLRRASRTVPSIHPTPPRSPPPACSFGICREPCVAMIGHWQEPDLNPSWSFDKRAQDFVIKCDFQGQVHIPVWATPATIALVFVGCLLGCWYKRRELVHTVRHPALNTGLACELATGAA